MLHAQQISPDVWWVGGLDWSERSFHGYTTEMGITYNAYLIMDEHITLIDTTKKKFASELIDRISEVVDPAKIEYVVSNHVEMDHSGSLPEILALCPNATVVTSAPQGLAGLKAHFGDKYNYMGVKTGDTLNIGARTLTFVQTPMVHWPDNMVTYSAHDKILFSNDAFGQHIATSKRFDFENRMCDVMHQAKKYYANIVQPYAMQARKAYEAVKGLELDIVAPSHGVIWKEHIADILEAYDAWTSRHVEDKCVVVFDSMWGSTEAMAQAIVAASMAAGVECHLFDLKKNHESDIMTELMDARFVAVGSPTLNMQMLPLTSAFLTYMSGLSPKNDQRMGFAFGSFGWAPVGPTGVFEVLEKLQFNLPLDAITHKWTCDNAYLTELENQIRDVLVQAVQK